MLHRQPAYIAGFAFPTFAGQGLLRPFLRAHMNLVASEKYPATPVKERQYFGFRIAIKIGEERFEDSFRRK